MSNTLYNKQWHESQIELNSVLELEGRKEKDPVAAFQLLTAMYIKYIQVFHKIENCYDQIVHPQKRRVIKGILDGTIGRILELKNEMMNLELSDYHYFDDMLSYLKLTPNDVEIPIPKYFVHDRAKALREREQLLGQILSRMRPEEKEEISEIKLTREEAVPLIQKNERARQGRLRAKIMKDIREAEEKERKEAERGPVLMNADEAACLIQKTYRGYLTRRMIRKIREDELIWLGMKLPPQFGVSKSHTQTQLLKVEASRRVTQAMYEQEYQQAIISIKDKIREAEGPNMKEALQDKIRQWFIECREGLDKFPDFPEEEEGGSNEIFRIKSLEEIERLKLEEEEAAKRKKDKDKGKKPPPKKSEKKDENKDKPKGKGKGKGDEDTGWKFSESKFLNKIRESNEIYENVWKDIDESSNLSQKHDDEMIRQEKRVEVEQEVRIQVDELMRQELKNLKMAMDKEKTKRKKGKKGQKGKKGKKGKKEKDLTPERTIESLFEEMIRNGIIKKVSKTNLSDYQGEYNYLGTILQQMNIEPQLSLSDIRRLVTEFAILPLGSQDVHESAPLIKGVLLAGPPGVGKKMLVHAICNETGANLFDLSSKNLIDKYPGKDGLKMLMHLVLKVGRLLQPTVIFVDSCHLMFMKKIAKTEPGEPKRLKKVLPKLIKSLKPEDRLLLIGTSSQPFDAQLKPFCNLYQKIIMIPRPDHASRHLIWRKLILKHGGMLTDKLDVSSLAKISDGYTMGQILKSCQEVLNEKRLLDMNRRPLRAVDFVNPLSKMDPVFSAEEEALKNWFAKTPLVKKRVSARLLEEEEAAKAKKTAKKKK